MGHEAAACWQCAVLCCDVGVDEGRLNVGADVAQGQGAVVGDWTED